MRISDWSSDVCSSDLLPFALGLAEDGANERHISVPRGVRRFGQAGRQQPVDHIPAHLVEPLAAKMGGEPADTLHIIPAGLLVRLLLQPPQSRLVPGPLRLFLQSARFPKSEEPPVVIFLGLPPVGRSSRASNSRSVRCCYIDREFR